MATILEAVQNVGHHALPLLCGQILVTQRQVDVFRNRQIVQQVITLEDHADVFAGQVGTLLAVQFTEKFHNFARLRGMQIAGWFVGQQQFRRVNHGARNAHQLLLPAGELRGKQIFFGDNT